VATLTFVPSPLLPFALQQKDGDSRYQDNSPGPAGGSTIISTIFIDFAARVAVSTDCAERARTIFGVDIVIRIGVSVQAGHFTVEVGGIPTNLVQDNPILQAKLLEQFC